MDLFLSLSLLHLYVGRYGFVLILIYIYIDIIVVGRYGFVLIFKLITFTLTLLS